MLSDSSHPQTEHSFLAHKHTDLLEVRGHRGQEEKGMTEDEMAGWHQ